MKAVEFVKKFGWRDAISCIKTCARPDERWLMHWGSLVADTDFDDLKRLVESHELVEEYGGLDKAKTQAERFRLNTCIKMHGFMCRIISDVESCK